MRSLQDILTDLSAESEDLNLECGVQDCSAHKVRALGFVFGNVPSKRSSEGPGFFQV